MVWCGVVWCGVVWRGVAWHGMVWGQLYSQYCSNIIIMYISSTPGGDPSALSFNEGNITMSGHRQGFNLMHASSTDDGTDITVTVPAGDQEEVSTL